MNTILSETDYKSVPAEQKERLHAFRTTHQREHIDLLGQRGAICSGDRAPRPS
jgi:hypothetical protein